MFKWWKNRNTQPSLQVAYDRRRLANTMPGETGALAANRLGWFIG
jgi:hypothetical protein